MYRLKSKNKGITLIELILALSLVGLVITSAFSILSFGNKVHKIGMDEYEIQTFARLTVEHVSSIARYATAVFTIPESSFKEDNLTPGWDYVGIIDGAVVKFTYQEVDGVWDHYKEVIAPASDKVNYAIHFNKVENDHEERIIGFSIIGFIDGQPIEYDEDGNPIGHITIISQSESLNSMQVVHKGNGIEKATAVAYRTSKRDDPVLEIIKPIAQVALVLDTSGSMEWAMDGSSSNISVSNRRITKLKNSATNLINSFAASEYPIYVSLVPFSTDANNPYPFYRADTNRNDLVSAINGLTAVGGTNTGDGIRRGYYRLVSNRTKPEFSGRNVSDYLILLVDGVSTYGSVVSSYNNTFYTSDGNVSSSQIKGNGSSLDVTYGMGYVNAIGNMVRADGHIKVYVIGFAKSNNANTEREFRENLNYIGEKTGAERTASGDYYYLAGDEDELDIIFGSIQKEIINDLWYIDGPQLVR